MLSIIIVSYNCKDFLREAIVSLQNIENAYEIIVVDNNSSDGTQNLITALFPHVHFITNNFNAGFSAANNQGFKLAKGENILLLNPDAKLINKDIQQALLFIEEQPKTLLGPMLLNTDGSEQESVYPISNAATIFSEAFFMTYLFKKNNNQVYKGNNFGLSGACLLMKRELYEKLEGFDTNLFWMDDIDFCERAKALGYQLVYFPQWQVMHHIGQSGKKNYKVAIANQLISKLKYLKKKQHTFSFIMASIFIQIHIFLRLLIFLVLGLFKNDFRIKFFAYWHTQSLFLKYIFTGKNQTF